jgi:hypothetical protein
MQTFFSCFFCLRIKLTLQLSLFRLLRINQKEYSFYFLFPLLFKFLRGRLPATPINRYCRPAGLPFLPASPPWPPLPPCPPLPPQSAPLHWPFEKPPAPLSRWTAGSCPVSQSGVATSFGGAGGAACCGLGGAGVAACCGLGGAGVAACCGLGGAGVAACRGIGGAATTAADGGITDSSR